MTSRKSTMLNCYICAKEFGSQSIKIHCKSCRKKFEIEQEQKAPKDRTKCPDPPANFDDICLIAQG